MLSNTGPTQMQMFYREQAKIAEVDKLFLDLVADGLTSEELRRNIEKRPTTWERFKPWLPRLPQAPKPASA